MTENFFSKGESFQNNAPENNLNASQNIGMKPAVPANDAYFHPLFAPYTQTSSAGRSKMQSLGFVPRRII